MRRGAGMLCKQPSVSSSLTFSTTIRVALIRTPRGRPFIQDGGVWQPAASPENRVTPRAGAEPAPGNERREVIGESNTKLLLVPAMPTRKAHHCGKSMGEARRARIPASQQPASSARKRGHRARRIASAHWLTFNQSGDRDETKDHAGAAEESTGRTSVIPQGRGARQERKGHAASSKNGTVGA
jgi:hypothetical protein